MGYIANFIVYTLAMVGVIVFALFVFKNATSGTSCRSSKYLKVVDSMSLGPRKTLYIVSTGKEKFLIAGDVDKTSLISKLEMEDQEVLELKDIPMETKPYKSFQETLQTIPRENKKNIYMDTSINDIKSSFRSSGYNTINTSVMKNLAERIK